MLVALRLLLTSERWSLGIVKLEGNTLPAFNYATGGRGQKAWRDLMLRYVKGHLENVEEALRGGSTAGLTGSALGALPAPAPSSTPRGTMWDIPLPFRVSSEKEVEALLLFLQEYYTGRGFEIRFYRVSEDLRRKESNMKNDCIHSSLLLSKRQPYTSLRLD